MGTKNSLPYQIWKPSFLFFSLTSTHTRSGRRTRVLKNCFSGPKNQKKSFRSVHIAHGLSPFVFGCKCPKTSTNVFRLYSRHTEHHTHHTHHTEQKNILLMLLISDQSWWNPINLNWSISFYWWIYLTFRHSSQSCVTDSRMFCSGGGRRGEAYSLSLR
jgi:hypothetical protein